MSDKQSQVLQYLNTVESAKKSDIYQNVKFGYFLNWEKHLGELLSRMVKRGMIDRVERGVYTKDGASYTLHKHPILFKSNPFAALKKQTLPRMVEVNDGGRWFRSELLADLSGTSGISHPFVTRLLDNSELLACDQVREIEEPSQKEVILTTEEVFDILAKAKGVDASQIKIKDK